MILQNYSKGNIDLFIKKGLERSSILNWILYDRETERREEQW